MRLSVFGLGYVGTVTAGCFAEMGHAVIGVDPNSSKVDLIRGGLSPIVEDRIGGIINRAVANDRLRATVDARDAVLHSDLILVCVGTPSQPNSNLDYRYVRRVCEEIGSVLRDSSERRSVVIRSTILPGTMARLVIPTLEEASGKRFGEDFGVANNPEFLREGSAVHDFFNPPKTVIGESHDVTGRLLASLYANIDAPLIRTSMAVAEMVKYVDNAWHALKVVFGNEIGNICKEVGIDSHTVMDIFCRDTKLNLSSYYLKPGFAFGGSCLPKDLRALTYTARKLDLELPVLTRSRRVIDSNWSAR